MERARPAVNTRRLWVGAFVALLLGATRAHALILPPEGVGLNHIHVQFEWTAVGGVDQYQLQVVPDDLSPDPFASGTPVVDVTLGAATPRTEVTSGLAFDEAYAWRVRGIDMGTPLGWGPTHRFTTDPIPSDVPAITVTPGSGTPEPGLTLFNISSRTGAVTGGLALAVDASGEVVWFLQDPDGIGDIRLLDNGRLLYTGGCCARETLLNGQPSFRSVAHPDFLVHHEAYPMPSGNVLTLVQLDDEVVRNSEIQLWRGDRIVEFDRTTGEVVWDWNTFDHYSTQDFDFSIMQTPTVNGTIYDWTHANAVVYNAAEDAIEISVRHLSRITRIDRSTGNVIFNMGLGPPSMPTGDAEFGDNLFTFQHALENLANGNMMIYDNGNRRDHMDQTSETGVTKAIEVEFTGNPPTSAAIVWEHTLPNYSPFVGDVDRQPGGTTLINMGPSSILTEVDASGTEVWRLELPSGFPSYLIYRAERIASLNPDAPGDSDGDGLADFVDNCPDHAGAAATDTDGDGMGDACDVDDDGDFLLDVYETGTGVFVSATNTGSDPLDADSDGDGLADGDEVVQGSNPNTPENFDVPAMSVAARGLLVSLLAAFGAVRWGRRAREDRPD